MQTPTLDKSEMKTRKMSLENRMQTKIEEDGLDGFESRQISSPNRGVKFLNRQKKIAGAIYTLHKCTLLLQHNDLLNVFVWPNIMSDPAGITKTILFWTNSLCDIFRQRFDKLNREEFTKLSRQSSTFYASIY